MFEICEGKGFALNFDNGYRVSVQFGFGNYCEHYLNMEMLRTMMTMQSCTSINAEIAVFKDDELCTGKIVKKLFNEGNEDDPVCGYLNADAVAKLIGYVSQIDSKKRIAETKQIETKDK